MREGLSFILGLLAAICAENIPLALGLTLAAALAMALPQILDRLRIWAKKRAAPGAGTPRAAKWKTQCRSLSIPILRDSKEKCKMNPKEELAAAILALTDEEANQVIALAIQAGLMGEAT